MIQISAIFLRQFLLIKRSFHRLLGIFYWSFLELLLWGFFDRVFEPDRGGSPERGYGSNRHRDPLEFSHAGSAGSGHFVSRGRMVAKSHESFCVSLEIVAVHCRSCTCGYCGSVYFRRRHGACCMVFILVQFFPVRHSYDSVYFHSFLFRTRAWPLYDRDDSSLRPFVRASCLVHPRAHSAILRSILSGFYASAMAPIRGVFPSVIARI